MNPGVRSAAHILLAVLGIASAAFGVGFMLAPAPIWQIYGVQLDLPGTFIARMFGTANVGAGLLVWWARSALARREDPQAFSRLLGTLAIWSVARGLVTSMALAAGLINGSGWIFVAYDGVLLLLYGLLFIRVRKSLHAVATA